MTDLSDKLRIVRKFTGHRFGPGRGYDARKSLSRSRQRTINKYYEIVRELTDRPHKIIVPKKGQKRETFSFTGQLHMPKFVKAIIVVPDAGAQYKFFMDKQRPKGSRFTMINRRTGEKSWHIPASAFLDENELLYEEDQDNPPEFFQAVLEEYAVGGQVYMIEAGEYHMWGSAGTVETISQKISELFKQYSAGVFDANDANSHFVGNWFRGIQVYSPTEAAVYMGERAEHEAKRIREFNEKAGGNVMQFGRRFRLLKSGDIGEFVFGKLVHVHHPLTTTVVASKDRRRKSRAKKPPYVKRQ